MKVRITREAEAAIASVANNPLGFQRAEVEADGLCTIELNQTVLERLRDRQFPGETISDTIIRAVHAMGPLQ